MPFLRASPTSTSPGVRLVLSRPSFLADIIPGLASIPQSLVLHLYWLHTVIFLSGLAAEVAQVGPSNTSKVLHPPFHAPVCFPRVVLRELVGTLSCVSSCYNTLHLVLLRFLLPSPLYPLLPCNLCGIRIEKRTYESETARHTAST